MPIKVYCCCQLLLTTFHHHHHRRLPPPSLKPDPLGGAVAALVGTYMLTGNDHRHRRHHTVK